MVETWRQLQSQRAGQQRTAEAVDIVRNSWDEKHTERDELTRYTDTYDDVIEALRNRYMDPGAEAWFSGNEDFLKELDDLFTKLKAHEANVTEIEARILKEKQEWYRRTLHGSAAGLVAEKALGRSAFLGALDENANWDDTAQRIRRALDAGATNPKLSDVLSRLDGLEGEKRVDALIDLFFRDPITGDVPASCAGAVEALRRGTSLEQTIRDLQQGRAGSTGAKTQATKIRRELAELKRGQAGHMQDKMAKARNRQRKQQGPRIEAALYESLPTGADLDEVRACVLCQVFASLELGKGHVYTSAEGYEEEHERHVADEHQCAAGEQCVQLTDEDVDMSGHDDEGPAICRECAEDLRRPTVYCSARCAGSDFRSHREGVHMPARRGSGRSAESDSKHLVHGDEDKGEYHAEDIHQFVWGLDEAMDRFLKGKNPDMEIKAME